MAAVKEFPPTPPVPSGRLEGQRFFRAGDKDFHYVRDEPCVGYSGDRPTVWLRAWNHALTTGAAVVEERTNQRLNDYVGSGVFGLNRDRSGALTSDRLSGIREYGASIVLASYNVREVS